MRTHPEAADTDLSRDPKEAIVALVRAGRDREAEDRARGWAGAHPEDAFGHAVLGSLLLGRGLAGEALPHLALAARLAPRAAEVQVNHGLALAETGDPEAALDCYARALTLSPGCLPALTNRGGALEALGRPGEAVACYDAVLALCPDHAKALYNRGNALRDLGRQEEALASYARALALAPDYAFARVNRGIVLADLGRPGEAEAEARQALAAAPDLPQALDLLARCLLARDADPAAAMSLVERSLALDDGVEAKRLFVACAARLPTRALAAGLAGHLARALAEPWDRPERLAATAALVLESDPVVGPCLDRAVTAWPADIDAATLFGPAGPAALGAHRLLTALLESGPVCAVPLERLCTLARRALLALAETGDAAVAADPDALRFFAALAVQCHVNEYAFAATDDEERRAATLTATLGEAGASVLALLAAAAYLPLADLPEAAALAEAPWPPAARHVLAAQVREVLAERALRRTMPRLTPIEDEVSLRVRRQYEEHPYPRWARTAPADAPQALDASLRRRFPRAPLAPVGGNGRLDVLVAGCGSGRHTLETARRFRGAEVLAVDLSLASLAYAKRKAAEAGAANIRFAQADILALGSLDRRFDLIESSGVLHHLAAPYAGWRTLAGLLRPGGVMRLGFYSALARRDIPRARVLLQMRGYAPTTPSLRRCRQELLSLPEGDPLRRLLMQDVFTISGCRDLFFHVSEQTVTLPVIANFLAQNGLTFLGFDIEPETLADYMRRFPDDPAATDLVHWHDYETEHQDTFLEMYQFWIQKNPG